MSRRHVSPAILAALAVIVGLGTARTAQAAPYLSEVFLTGPVGGPAVEVAGLQGVATFTLVTVNARSSGAIVTEAYEYHNPTNAPALVLAGNAWPTGLWMDPTTAAARVDTSHGLAFNLLTELLLFEGTTELDTGGNLSNPGDALTAARWLANPAADALAWGPRALAVPFAATQVLDTDDGDLIIRPIVNGLVQMDGALIGSADAVGAFTAGDSHYLTNPGFTNPDVATLAPEPGGVWAMLGIAAVALLQRRGVVCGVPTAYNNGL